MLRKRISLEDSRASSSDAEDLVTRCVILDFTSLTYIDPSGVNLLRQLKADYGELDVGMYIAGCSGKLALLDRPTVQLNFFSFAFRACIRDVYEM